VNLYFERLSDYRSEDMKYIWQIFQSFLIISVLLLLILSIHVPGQTIEPDEQIVREMMAYVKKTEDTQNFSRPRIIQSDVVFKNARQIQAEKKSFKESQLAGVASESSDLERQAFAIINEKRAENGLPPLRWSEEIARVARLHSVNMARYKFFSHTGVDGTLVNNRADLLGISQWLSIGENIAFNRGFKKPVESACQQWMNSPSHRENILDRKWRESGVGLAIASDGTFYFTEVFVK
jgi:uncharacterized protein YkwD